MNAQKKLNFFFLLIIIGLIVSIVYISLNVEKATNEQVSLNNNKSQQLIEVFTTDKLHLNGVISASTVEEVQMNISGKIDKNNRSLNEGEEFKKNEILIKVERLTALYEILSSRSEFKELIQKLIPSIDQKLPDESKKWKNFENQIEKTLPLPTLPIINSKSEEDLLNSLHVFSLYYKAKRSESKVEDYLYIAPFDGTILKSNVHSSSTVHAGKTLLVLAKKNSYQVSSHIQLKDLNRINKKDTIDFLSANGDFLTKGKFLKTGAKLSDSSTVEIYFSIFSQNQNLLNKTVQISFYGKPTKIPTAAVLNDSVEIVAGDKSYKLFIQKIKEVGDSTIVEGLPQHSFVNVNP